LIPNGLEGKWLATQQLTRKGKSIFQRCGAQALGLLHPRSKVPKEITLGKAYRMRVVAGGAMHQLDWLSDED
jgi:hypothetical protein